MLSLNFTELARYLEIWTDVVSLYCVTVTRRYLQVYEGRATLLVRRMKVFINTDSTTHQANSKTVRTWE